jgi:hypothetical protein
MSMLKRAALIVAEDAEGANGDLDYGQRLASAAESLVDYVYEALLDYGPEEKGGYGYGGYGYGTIIDIKVYGALQLIVAAAMIAQYEHDKECWGEVIAAIVNEAHARGQSPKLP